MSFMPQCIIKLDVGKVKTEKFEGRIRKVSPEAGGERRCKTVTLSSGTSTETIPIGLRPL